MKITSKILRTLAWIVLIFVLFVSSWLLAALALPLFTVNSKPVPGNDVAIYIQTNGDHIDIIVPVKNCVKDWQTEIRYQNTNANDNSCKYLALGFGDKDFFINVNKWSRLTLCIAFRAISGQGIGALRTTFYSYITKSHGCREIRLSYAQYTQLVTFIDHSFAKDAKGHVVPIQNALYDTEASFYQASEKYSLFYTCNTWSNNALKACGQKACLWTAFDVGIFYHYR